EERDTAAQDRREQGRALVLIARVRVGAARKQGLHPHQVTDECRLDHLLVQGLALLSGDRHAPSLGARLAGRQCERSSRYSEKGSTQGFSESGALTFACDGDDEGAGRGARRAGAGTARAAVAL